MHTLHLYLQKLVVINRARRLQTCHSKREEISSSISLQVS
jgi:hypothetical protein